MAYMRGDESRKQSEGVSVLCLRSQKERKRKNKVSVIFPSSLIKLLCPQIISPFQI